MTIRPKFEKQTISTVGLRYTKGIRFAEEYTRSHDSCYYQIVPDLTDASLLSLEQQKAEKVEIKVTVNAAKEMNVYLYGGPNRLEATKSIVQNNEQVQVGKTYSVDYRVGFLLVAYPKEKKTTEFSFSYQLVASGFNKEKEEIKIIPKVKKEEKPREVKEEPPEPKKYEKEEEKETIVEVKKEKIEPK